MLSELRGRIHGQHQRLAGVRAPENTIVVRLKSQWRVRPITRARSQLIPDAESRGKVRYCPIDPLPWRGAHMQHLGAPR